MYHQNNLTETSKELDVRNVTVKMVKTEHMGQGKSWTFVQNLWGHRNRQGADVSAGPAAGTSHITKKLATQ